VADNEIRLIPEIPGTLVEAAQNGTLIPFIGAGVSCLAGCPNWTEFADGALHQLIATGRFSHAQLAQLKDVSPRVKLSLALSLQEELKVNIDFKALLHNRPDWKNDPRGHRVYAALSRLGSRFVTTNYDEWLDDDMPVRDASVQEMGGAVANSPPTMRTVFWKSSDLTAANLTLPNTVFHLHGSLRDPSRMVLTTAGYLTHYASDRRKPIDQENIVLTFLDGLFANNNILFVGYGLKELEILEYIVLKARRTSDAAVAPRHFLLEGFFSHQLQLMLFMKRYYRDCGIELIPFLMDDAGHDQLLNVLEDFSTRLPAKPMAVLAELNLMEELLNAK